MSVVVVRDGVMAADTAGRGGNIRTSLRKMIFRDGIAIGWVGTWADGKTFAEWYLAGAAMDTPPKYIERHREDDQPDFAAIVLKPGGWEYWHEFLVPETTQDILMPFFAIGSGAAAALGAMHMGATAIEAVEVACKVNPDCDLPLESARVE